MTKYYPLQDRVADAADEIEMRRDLDAFGGGRPYTYDHATGHVEWQDGVQASVWRDEDGTFRAVDVTPPAEATTDGDG